jgi:penicillin-binding protein 1B
MFDNQVNGKPAITKDELLKAKATPLKLAPPNAEADEAPYYVDLVRGQLLGSYSESELNNGGLKVFTPLDLQLQRAASQAIASGMKRVDALTKGERAQVALVALDPHTGEVLALSGGRDYGKSQLNHATSKRPTGSIFKPFVYGAAIATGTGGDQEHAYTQISLIDTSAGVFSAPGEDEYSPRNFDSSETGGEVTLRNALAHSINTATVRLAQQLGFEKVAELARSAGIEDVKPTPSMAIGSYSATPLQMAGAYTAFANNGTYIEPMLIRSVQGRSESDGETFEPTKKDVIDARVAAVVTDMLSAVMNEGTAAAAVHGKFAKPAAGKTGTSHDAWFAGYTTNLLCVVWVGYDDYADIKLEGGKAAAPIWTDFMVRASNVPRYRDMKPFSEPTGVATVAVDRETNLPATDKCPDDYQAAFIDGTVPRATCEHPSGDTRNVLQRMLGLGDKGGTLPAKEPDQPQTPKKKGFWKRLFGGKNKSTEPNL